MSDSRFSTAIHLIQEAKSIAILAHLRPDGDAYGSTLGLGLSLAVHGKSVKLYNEDGLIDRFKFLPGSSRIEQTPDSPQDIDLIITVDTSVLKRVGKRFMAWDQVPQLNIDHHVSNENYAAENIVFSDAPSTASVILQLLTEGEFPITPEVATNLYVGISTDTGSFRYRGTTAHTFRDAAKLVECGADPASIALMCYQNLSTPQFLLRQSMISAIELETSGTLAHTRLTPEMFEKAGASQHDTEGLVEMLQEIGSVRVSALFEMRSDGSMKVSLRSKDSVNVSQLAQQFGGGGHTLAAGINFESDGEENRKRVLNAVREALSIAV